MVAGLRTQDSWRQLFPSEPTVPLKPSRRLGALSQKRVYVEAKWGWAAGRGGEGVWEAEQLSATGCWRSPGACCPPEPSSVPATTLPVGGLAWQGRPPCSGPLGEQGKGSKPRQTAWSLTRMGLTTKDRRTDNRRTVTLSSGPHQRQALSAEKALVPCTDKQAGHLSAWPQAAGSVPGAPG